MITNRPNGDQCFFLVAMAFAVLLAMMAFSWVAHGQTVPYLVPPAPSPTTIVPFDRGVQGPTYVLPPAPPPRIDYPPGYTPPAPIVICTRFGNGTICQ